MGAEVWCTYLIRDDNNTEDVVDKSIYTNNLYLSLLAEIVLAGFQWQKEDKMKRIGWKVSLILAVIILSIWAVTPLDKKIKRGLDLKGGMHLVLKVEFDDAIRLRTDRSVSQLKRLFNEASIPYEKIKRVGIDGIEINGVSENARTIIQEILEESFSQWEVKDSSIPLRLSLPVKIQNEMKEHCIKQSIETIRQRINEYGVNDAGVQRLRIQGEDSILVSLPDVHDPNRVKELLQSTALLEFKHVKAGPFPTEKAALEMYNGYLLEDLMIFQTNSKRMQPAFYILTAESMITGDDLKSVSSGRDGFGGWEVHFSLTPEGAERFRTYSAANIGRYLSIVFDHQIESVARIEDVLSYHTRITGNYSYEEVNDMVLKLRSGALTASLTPIEERVIGPSLGEDSIIKGITAAVTGLLLIMIFMVIYYRAAGVNSVIALLLNILLLMGTVAYFGFTLTLPGIAGIILTIGMAVDANVLIFERIKEEMHEGKSSKTAIDKGFKKAFVSILDANLTTVIAAIFLMQFGTGPIKGFAVTLIIGICASMFTALFVSRVIFDLVYVKGRKKQFKLSPLKTGKNLFFKKQSGISFMNKPVQWTAYVLSSLIVLAGIITYFSRGFNLGIDFTGGQMIEVSFTEKVAPSSSTNVNKAEALRARLQQMGLSQAIIQQVDTTGNRFFIRSHKLKNTQSQITNHKQDSIPRLHNSDKEAENTSLDKSNNKKFLRMRHGIKGGAVFSKSASLDLPEEVRILSTHTVGPQVGAAMKHKVFLAVFWALLGMLIYIGVRFKWVYGVAAVLTLVHDILICLTILLIFNIEITLPVAAALLTIMGYSLNDAIVIFDRVRDNIKHMVFKKPGGKEAILNQSINQTLGRTIVTSGTTLAAVLAIFFFGGEVLHDFSFTLIIGIIVGTYSSIFQSCAWLRLIPCSIGSR